MLGSQILEIAIGMIFIYLLLSLICSALNEVVLSGLLTLRAKMLEDWVKRLLENPELLKSFYDHPLIKALKGKTLFGGSESNPAYIPTRTFALALLDTLANNQGLTSDSLKKLTSSLGSDILRIEKFFDDSMDLLKGWYKRRTQIVIFIWAIFVSIILNADTLKIGDTLWHDPTLRAALVASAEAYAKQPSPTPATVDALQKQIQELQLPLGWCEAVPTTTTAAGSTGASTATGDFDDIICPGAESKFLTLDNPVAWLAKLAGLIITVFAISQGAPFWFDLLNKVTNLRSAATPPPKAEEANR